MSAVAPEIPICRFCTLSKRGHNVEMEAKVTLDGQTFFECPCCDRVGDNKVNLMHDQHEAGFNQVSDEEYGFDPLPTDDDD